MQHVIALSLIVLEPVIRASKKYHTQTFLEECKYEVKKKKNGEAY